MNQIKPDFIIAAQNYVPRIRQDLAAAIDSDEASVLLVEAKSTIFALEQVEKLLRVGCWSPPPGTVPPRLEISDILSISLATVFLRMAAAIAPHHPKTRRAMSMLGAVSDELAWQINNDGDRHG